MTEEESTDPGHDYDDCWELGCKEPATKTIVAEGGEFDLCAPHAKELVEVGGCEYAE